MKRKYLSNKFKHLATGAFTAAEISDDLQFQDLECMFQRLIDLPEDEIEAYSEVKALEVLQTLEADFQKEHPDYEREKAEAEKEANCTYSDLICYIAKTARKSRIRAIRLTQVGCRYVLSKSKVQRGFVTGTKLTGVNIHSSLYSGLSRVLRELSDLEKSVGRVPQGKSGCNYDTGSGIPLCYVEGRNGRQLPSRTKAVAAKALYYVASRSAVGGCSGKMAVALLERSLEERYSPKEACQVSSFVLLAARSWGSSIDINMGTDYEQEARKRIADLVGITQKFKKISP